MTASHDAIQWIDRIKSRKGADVCLKYIELREDITPNTTHRQFAMQASYQMPTILKCLGGLCELYSRGKLLKRYDQSEKFDIAPDGRGGVKVVIHMDDFPFEVNKDIYQAIPR